MDLETWASQVEVRLEEEREGALKACHGDQFTQILQRYQVPPLFPRDHLLQPSLKSNLLLQATFSRREPSALFSQSFSFSLTQMCFGGEK